MSTISASTTSTTAYKVTADTTGTLVLQTGSTPTTAVTIDTSQKVGIGTGSPSNPLTVQKANGGDFVALFQNTTSATPYCVWIKDASSSTSGYPLLNVTDNAGTGTYFRVDSSTGNVCIGTNSSTSKLRIDSTGGAASSTFATTAARAGWQVSSDGGLGTGTKLLSGIGSSAYAWLQVQNSNDNATYDLAINPVGGNVMMGTTSATVGSKLTIYQGAASNVRAVHIEQLGNYEGLNIKATSLTYADVLSRLQTARSASTAFYFNNYDANGVDQFKIRGDGTIFAQNTTVQSVSDIRLKENIIEAEDGLSIITAIRPVRFDFKEGFGNDRKNVLGFIAQEMEQVFPDAVDVFGESDDPENPYKSVGTGALIPVLVKAIQELKAELDAAKADIATLKGAA